MKRIELCSWVAFILMLLAMAGSVQAAKTPVTQSSLELRIEELERKVEELEKRLPPMPTWGAMNLITPCVAQYGIDAGAAK